MPGQLLAVWQDSWSHLWAPLARKSLRLGHPDLFCELYPDLNRALVVPKSVEALAQITADVQAARREFRRVRSGDLGGELQLLAFMEGCYETLEDLGGDTLSNAYFVLLDRFLERFGLRYDLRRPCMLCPTLPGLFATLIRELNALGQTDGNIARRLNDFREAVQDLRLGQSEGRMANCVAKQVMLLEAIGSTSAGITGTELSGICSQVRHWPHPAMRSSLLNLYGFTSDFPGLRHGTPSAGMLRDIDMRDMIAVSILLAGFTPYLSDQMDADVLYRGS